MTPWPRYLLWLLASIVVVVALFAPIGLGLAYERREASRLWLLISVGGLFRARLRLAPSRLQGREHGHAGADERVNSGTTRRRSAGGEAGRPGGADAKGEAPTLRRVVRRARIARQAYLFASQFLRIEELEWRTEIGTGDAAATGLAVGSLWALKSTVVGVLARYHVFLRAPRLAVTPAFDKPRFALEIRCIFRFSLGDIIVAVLKRLVRPKRG